MLEELKNKKVKLVVSSNSGMSAHGGVIVATSMIIAEGILAEYDSEFVKLKDAQVMRNNVLDNKSGSFNFDVQPRVESSDVTLINRNNIITISILNN